MSEPINDLHVIPTSEALQGKSIDVVITGSIAAVESVRFIRALRRLGATVTPWLSQGGAQFITPMAISWAAGKDPVLTFSGSTSHIATSDAVVVSPASANFLANVARGSTDSHCTALVASALGQKKPVFLLPAMHDSLKSAPAIQKHLETIHSWPNVHLLRAREEEGKQKFPEPESLADEVAHGVNKPEKPNAPVLITMGTTRGYIDDVRYISNYSSGKLGSVIAEELYRHGFSTFVVAGPSEVKPRLSSSLKSVLTTNEMMLECQNAAANSGLAAAIFCASVLDYEPTQRTIGKIKSGRDTLSVDFKPTPKIIETINIQNNLKVGFKLEVGLGEKHEQRIAEEYIQKYKLAAIIVNELSAVSSTKHEANAFQKDANGTLRSTALHSKAGIARFVIQLLNDTFKPAR